MSFTLRQITRRAGGGEIARTSTLGQVEVIVGRGTECDIQIPDLAVLLRHARLRLLPSGRVAVEALGRNPLQLGRRFVERAEVDPAAVARLTLGSHLLTIGEGETAGNIVITVERMAELPASAALREAEPVFGLTGVLPGKRGMAWAGLLVVLGVCLAWPIWASLQPREVIATTVATTTTAARGVTRIRTAAAFHPDQLWTSGPLSSAHVSLSKDCGACHDKPFEAVRDTTCRNCHDALPDHAAPSRMLTARGPATGRIAVAKASLDRAVHLDQGRCASCHKEHEGAGGALMVASSFCSDCHAALERNLPDTALRNVVDFNRGDGHPQFRAEIVTRPDAVRPQLARVSLDARPRENSGLKFPHRLHLSATGGVARMAQGLGPAQGFGDALECADCHTPDAGRVRFTAVTMEKNCAMCHDLAFARDRRGLVRTLPHGEPEQVVGVLRDYAVANAAPAASLTDRRRPGLAPAVLASELRTRAVISTGARTNALVRSVFEPGGACFDCHQVTQPTRARGLDFGIAPVSVTDHYLRKGRFPHRKHVAARCETCHAAKLSDSAADVLLPGVATCQECHGNPRQARAVPSTCQTCHGFHEGVAPAAVPPPPPSRKVASVIKRANSS